MANDRAGGIFCRLGHVVRAGKRTFRRCDEAVRRLLIEHEWRRWAGTANIYGAYEFGDDVDNEFETALVLQGRYRHSRELEAAVEVYLGEDTKGLGPVMMGSWPLVGRRQLRWEGGIIFGLDSDTADQTLRVLFEYEF